MTTCEEMLQALEDAGLRGIVPQMLAGNGLVKGTPEQLAKKEKICEGAVPREHSHFFTEWGTSGSLDWNGDQVDDGVYEIVDDRTFTIGDATFHFDVQGDELMLEPVLGWMVAVASPARRGSA